MIIWGRSIDTSHVFINVFKTFLFLCYLYKHVYAEKHFQTSYALVNIMSYGSINIIKPPILLWEPCILTIDSTNRKPNINQTSAQELPRRTQRHYKKRVKTQYQNRKMCNFQKTLTVTLSINYKRRTSLMCYTTFKSE